MTNTCKFTTLKNHSAGNKYTPVQDGMVWNLANAQGGLLIGNRGKVYEFISENTARSWLINNLSRLKNSTKPTSNDYILKLGQYYIDEAQDYLIAEIEAIEELIRGVWQPVEETSGGGSAEPITLIDGGNASTVYQNQLSGGEA